MKSLITLLVAITAFNASAAQNPIDKQHRIGVEIAGANVELKGSSSDANDMIQLYTYYNYSLDQYLSIEAGINSAVDVDEWKCRDINDDKWTCDKQKKSYFNIGADEIKYSNLVVAAKGAYPLSQRNSVYGKIGAQYYDYNIKQSGKSLNKDSGLGLFVGAGWQYQWDMGLAINAGVKYYDMGDIKSVGSTVGISYQF
ncbi:MAG: porin family protein [Gammaproteobacteria bacterium]|nr:porin family protein [Gammaproteobacteria bacterium]